MGRSNATWRPKCPWGTATDVLFYLERWKLSYVKMIFFDEHHEEGNVIQVSQEKSLLLEFLSTAGQYPLLKSLLKATCAAGTLSSTRFYNENPALLPELLGFLPRATIRKEGTVHL